MGAIYLPIVSEFRDQGVQDATQGLGKLSKQSGRFSTAIGKSMKVAGMAIAGVAAGVGAAAVVGFQLAKAAAEDEAAATKLAGALKRSAGATAGQVAATEKLIGQMALATGVADDELRPAMESLVRGSGDIATASKDLGLALDIAAGSGKDVGSVADALSQAYGGNLRALGALDPQVRKMVKEGASLDEVMGQLASTFGGAAAEGANTTEGKMRRLGIAFDEAKESVGAKLLPVLTKLVDWFMGSVMPTVERVMRVFDRRGLAGVWDLVTRTARDAFPKLLTLLADVGRRLLDQLAAWGQAFVDWIGPRIGPMLQKLGELVGKAANWLLDEGLPLLVDKLIQLGDALVRWIGPQIPPMLKELAKLVVAINRWIITEAYPKVVAQAARLAGALLGWLVDLLPQAVRGLAGFVSELAGKLPGLFMDLLATMGRLGADLGAGLINGVVGALKNLGNFSLDVGRSFANAIIGFVNDQVIDRINSLLEFTIDPPGPGSLTLNPPDIPRIPALAAGGIVTSPTLALIGEAGPEAVVPLDRMAGRGGPVVINVNGALDPVAVATQIRRLLNDDARRRTGSIAIA